MVLCYINLWSAHQDILILSCLLAFIGMIYEELSKVLLPLIENYNN